MKIALLVNLGLIIMVAAGAYVGATITPYILIGAICIIGFLVVKGWIKPKYFPIYIFGMALCMLWQVSMMGVHVVGSDIHIEYYISNLALQNGAAWNYPSQYATSIVVTLIAPAISNVFHIELVWVYKAVFPALLACVPVIMYFAFKRQFGEKRAYWATLFFMIVPVMSLEIIGIAKAMIAELFLALAILTLVSNLKQIHKGIILPILVVLAMLCHYTVGFILLGFLAAALGIRLVSKLRKVRGRVNLAVLSLAILLPCVTGYFYFSTVNSGVMMRTLASIVRMTTVNIAQNARNMSVVTETPASEQKEVAEVLIDEESDTWMPEKPTTTQERRTTFYVQQQPILVKAGVGLDFMSVSTEGKIFRIVQYTTQILLILGLIQLWRKRKEYNFTTEFVACILAGFALLGACIFIPFFSRLINMTRYYHMSLFFLAPLFVLGCEMVWNKRWFAPTVLLLYFAFTSGLVFEATQSNAIDKVNLPYSLALSGERTGIIDAYNKDDIACANWLVSESNQELPIVTDVNTKRLLQGHIKRIPRLARAADSVSITTIHISWTLLEVPDGDYYILLSTWNTEHNKLILYYDAGFPAGMRKMQDIPDDIYNLPIAFQSGKSMVLLMEVK